jgi:hypothetical protein
MVEWLGMNACWMVAKEISILFLDLAFNAALVPLGSFRNRRSSEMACVSGADMELRQGKRQLRGLNDDD